VCRSIRNQSRKLRYDRRFSPPVCLGVKHPSGAYDQIFITVRQLRVCWCGALSDEITGLPFTIAASPRQRTHSRVRVPGDSWPYFTVSDSRPPTWRTKSPYLYLQALGSLFVAFYDSQGYGGGIRTCLQAEFAEFPPNWFPYIAVARTKQEIPLLLLESLRNLETSHREHSSYCCVVAGTCILSRCLAMVMYHCHALKKGVYSAVA
jgi:hypothetical protein